MTMLSAPTRDPAPMLERALKKLEEQPDLYYGWDIRAFRDHFTQALQDRRWTVPRV